MTCFASGCGKQAYNLTLLMAHYIVLWEKVQQTDLICGDKDRRLKLFKASKEALDIYFVQCSSSHQSGKMEYNVLTSLVCHFTTGSETLQLCQYKLCHEHIGLLHKGFSFLRMCSAFTLTLPLALTLIRLMVYTLRRAGAGRIFAHLAIFAFIVVFAVFIH